MMCRSDGGPGPRRGSVTAEPAQTGPVSNEARNPSSDPGRTVHGTLTSPDHTGPQLSAWAPQRQRGRCPGSRGAETPEPCRNPGPGARSQLPPVSLPVTSQLKPAPFLRSRCHSTGSGADQASGDSTGVRLRDATTPAPSDPREHPAHGVWGQGRRADAQKPHHSGLSPAQGHPCPPPVPAPPKGGTRKGGHLEADRRICQLSLQGGFTALWTT